MHLGIGHGRRPVITTLKMLSGEEIVGIVTSKGRQKWTVAVPMKIVYDEQGSVHLVPWITAVVEEAQGGRFMWSDQAFEIAASHITLACCPMPVVEREFLKRLKNPDAWLNGADIDAFSVPDGMKIQ